MKKMLLVGLLLSALVSCGGGGGGADASVKGFLDSMKSGQFDKMAQYAEGSNGQSIVESFNKMPKEQRDLVGVLFSKLEYKIGKTDVQGDNATVALNLTNTDMKAMMTKVMTQAMPVLLSAKGKTPAEQQAMVSDLFKKAMNDGSNKTVTADTVVKLKKISGKWQISKDGNADFGNAFIGGIAGLGALGQ